MGRCIRKRSRPEARPPCQTAGRDARGGTSYRYFWRMPLLNRSMRRTALLISVLAIVAALPAAAQPPVFNLPVKAKLTDCHVGAQPTDRFAVFVGQMPA